MREVIAAGGQEKEPDELEVSPEVCSSNLLNATGDEDNDKRNPANQHDGPVKEEPVSLNVCNC